MLDQFAFHPPWAAPRPPVRHGFRTPNPSRVHNHIFAALRIARRLRAGSNALAFLLAIALALLPGIVLAQSGNADAGGTLWTAFRSVLYGPWGLVGSAVVVAIGIYMFLERGFMHALGVMAAGALIFFVPLIVISMRNTAQALGGGG
jgi:hypothetical protein